ncbi:MAG: HNH endonuclease signature motif containing protein [Patescibacteria group bacterium]
MKPCLQCKESTKRTEAIYCSNKCQLDFQYEQYIQKWKSGELSGSRGIQAKNISKHLRRYLLEKYDHKCVICRWSEKNVYTDAVPLEVDHIDGSSENNQEDNLRIICPNCHALTSNFRNLNKGKGINILKSQCKLCHLSSVARATLL